AGSGAYVEAAGRLRLLESERQAGAVLARTAERHEADLIRLAVEPGVHVVLVRQVEAIHSELPAIGRRRVRDARVQQAERALEVLVPVVGSQRVLVAPRVVDTRRQESAVREIRGVLEARRRRPLRSLRERCSRT